MKDFCMSIKCDFIVTFESATNYQVCEFLISAS